MNEIESKEVSFQAHEADMARMERNNNRMFVVILVLIVLIGILVYDRSQWVSEETMIESEQAAESGSNYSVGGDFVGGVPKS